VGLDFVGLVLLAQRQRALRGAAMTERACGTCSLCCKLPYVRELDKPMDTWCRHASPGRGGCLIHPDRPPSCRTFICGWLASTELGDEWFPARCKMYLKQRPKGRLVTVDPAFPTVWRREPYYSQLLAWAQRMQIKIRIGLRCIELNADGAEQEVTGTRAWIEGREEARS
jgi:Fe-S-cluster containining protein